MKREVEYIYGKHAVREMLEARPDVVVELHAAEDFSDEQILAMATQHDVLLKVLNLKNPPRLLDLKECSSRLTIKHQLLER
jgi:tRNA G18 (ribose-2'-O)-methylase SpoU